MDRIKTAPQESQAHIERAPCKRLCAADRYSDRVLVTSRPSHVWVVVSRLEDHQVIAVNDLFILLKTGDFLDVGSLEPLDSSQDL